MSQDKSVSDATENVSDISESEETIESTVSDQDKNDSVSLSTHRKLLNQRKRDLQKFEEELKQRERQIQELNEAKMQEDGKKDELIESLKSRLKDTETKYKSKTSAYAYKVIASQVEREAIKMGCVDTEGLLLLSDLSMLEPDEDFNIDGSDVKSMLEDIKEKRPYLFQKTAPTIKDGLPKKPDVNVANDLSKLSIQERALMVAKMKSQRG